MTNEPMTERKEKIIMRRVNVVATLCDASSRTARLMSAAIVLAGQLRLHRLRQRILAAYHRRFAVRTFRESNIVPTCALEMLAKAITGSLSSLAEVEVNKSALGTGTDAPAAGDTVLDTEVYRKDIASQSYASNVGYNTAFYTATEVSGTFYEHGIFANGTGSADTGTLVSRVLLNAPTGIAKTLTNTLTIEHEITFEFA